MPFEKGDLLDARHSGEEENTEVCESRTGKSYPCVTERKLCGVFSACSCYVNKILNSRTPSPAPQPQQMVVNQKIKSKK